MEFSYSSLDLREEVIRLSNELSFAQKCIKLLEKHRNCLINFNNNCECDRNFNNKFEFNLLENEYKFVFNIERQLDFEINKNTDQNESQFNEVLLNCETILETNNETVVNCNKSNNDLNKESNLINKKNVSNSMTSSHCTESNVLLSEKFGQSSEEAIRVNKQNIESSDGTVMKQTIDERISESDDDMSEGLVSNDKTNNRSNDTNKSYKGLTKETLLEGLRLKVIAEEFDPNNQLISALRPRNRSTSKTGAIIGYRCNWPDCYYIDPKKQRIAEHINQSHTGERPFVCDKCGAKFASKRYLRLHDFHNHSLHKKFKCKWDDCQYECNNLTNLNTHHNRHLNFKPFKCDFDGCEKTFFTKRDVSMHKITAHDDSRPFPCEWPGCESAFKTKCALKKHKVFHVREMKYSCDWPNCGATFCHAQSLRSHRLIHNGIRKYVCDWPECSKAFKCKFDLETHLRRHRGERPFKCHWAGCQKSYGLNKHLTEHLKTHEKKLKSATQ